ncbi:MAG: sensor histidine kinase, partial [Alkalispirochaeta sp.]
QSVREKELMLQEIHHRVKNNLQMVESLIALHTRGLTDRNVLDQIETIAGRIGTMSALHSTIYRKDGFGRVEMEDYIRFLVGQAQAGRSGSSSIRVEISVENIELEISHALPCGLIIHEALSNAHRYAFPDGSGGTVRIALTRTDADQLELTIRDNGVGLRNDTGPSADESAGGVGLTLIEILAQQLNGGVERTSSGGVSLRVWFLLTES